MAQPTRRHLSAEPNDDVRHRAHDVRRTEGAAVSGRPDAAMPGVCFSQPADKIFLSYIRHLYSFRLSRPLFSQPVKQAAAPDRPAPQSSPRRRSAWACPRYWFAPRRRCACWLKLRFQIDLEHCPNFSGRPKMIAAILAESETSVNERVITFLSLQAIAPPRTPARRQLQHAQPALKWRSNDSGLPVNDPADGPSSKLYAAQRDAVNPKGAAASLRCRARLDHGPEKGRLKSLLSNLDELAS